MRSVAWTGVVLASAAALGCVSCVHQIERGSHTMPSPPAVNAVMTRHVENAINAGEGDLQLRALRKRLAANAEDLDARLLLARLYLRRGLTDLALEHYRLAAAQFPDSVVVALDLAKTLRQMGEPVVALKTIKEHLAKYPSAGGNWELLSLEGILEDEQGRLAEAEASHRAALALEPGLSALHNNLGYNLLLQAQPGRAASEFHRAIEIDPRSEVAHNNLGTALAYESRAAEALSELGRTNDPAVAHNNLAALLIEQGRYAEARDELASALKFRRDFPAALANLRLVAAADGGAATVPAGERRAKSSKREIKNGSASGISVPTGGDDPAVGKK